MSSKQMEQEGAGKKGDNVQDADHKASTEDTRQAAVEKEEDTARLRSEQQSVKDGSGKADGVNE